MFRQTLAILVLLVLSGGAVPAWACAALANDWSFPATTTAEIYSNGARVVVRGTVDEPIILPSGFVRDTLELRAVGEFSRMPHLDKIELDADARPAPEGALAELAPELAQAINDCIDSLTGEVDDISHQVALSKAKERAQERAIERLEGVSSEHLLERNDWSEVATQLLESTRQLRSELLDMRRQRQAQEAELDQARRDLREGQQELRTLLHGALIVDPGDVSEAITVLGQRNDLRWEPHYRGNVYRDEDGWALAWQLHAAIVHSGADELREVDVTLSGKPASGPEVGLMPTLQAWIIRPVFEHKAARERFADSQNMAAMELARAPQATSVQHVDTQWQVGHINVPRERQTEIELAEPEVAERLRVVALPHQGERAMFVGELRNTGENAWPAGPIALHREGVRVGKERLYKPVAPGEAVELVFGEADKVELQRRLVHDKEVDASGLFRQSRARQREIELLVRNGYSVPIVVQVLEHLPVADDDRVRVSLHGDAPSHSEARGVRGLGAWEEELSPGEEVTWRVAYTVEWDSREVESVEGLDGPPGRSPSTRR